MKLSGRAPTGFNPQSRGGVGRGQSPYDSFNKESVSWFLDIGSKCLEFPK